jgi:hypothetical protein
VRSLTPKAVSVEQGIVDSECLVLKVDADEIFEVDTGDLMVY